MTRDQQRLAKDNTYMARKEAFDQVLGHVCSCCGADANEAPGNVWIQIHRTKNPTRSGLAKWRWINNNNAQVYYLPRCNRCTKHTPYNCDCAMRNNPLNLGTPPTQHDTAIRVKDRIEAWNAQLTAELTGKVD